MVSSVALLAAAASVVLAATPPGFRPAVSTELVVQYGSTRINGQAVAKNLTASQPQIGTRQRLNGTSYAVIMVDLDIPTNISGRTSTLLHWMQTGLAPAAEAAAVVSGTANRTASRADAVFVLRNTAGQAPAAAYIGPSPPPRIPLSHRYAQFLVDTSAASLAPPHSAAAALAALTDAAKTRQNFSLQQVLQRAGLADRVVAANFFNVTNPGPVQGARQPAAASSASASAASSASSTPAASPPPPSSPTPPSTAGVKTGDAMPRRLVPDTAAAVLASVLGLLLAL